MGIFSRGEHPDPSELAEVGLFAELAPDELAEIAKLAVRREVKAKATLIDQGRFGDAFYIISDGRADVFASGEYITTLSSGAAVGEMALVEHRPRNASVVAQTELVVAEFGVAEFGKLLDRYPTAKLRVMELLNARLHQNVTRDD